MEMSSWLGFSLSSAKEEEFDGGGGGGGGEGGVGGGRGGGDGGVGPLVLMPLSSDASVCLMESPLRQPQTSERKSDEIASAATVAATTTTASPNPDEQEPKFEDFLGGYSENSNEENHPRQHQPIPYFCDVCHSHSSGAPEINVNMPPSSAIAESEPTMENADAPYRYLHSNCHHHHHTLKPAFLIADATQNFTANAICNVGTEGSTSISSMKSWLRQQPAEANEARSLSLSMTSGFQMGSHEIVEEAVTDPKCLNGKSTTSGLVPRKSIETFGQRTSQYRGVTRHRWTGRYEAHLWDNSCRREGQSRKGRQVYLGGYDKEEKAARAYDLAALKYWGPTTHTNFPLSTYEKELKAMKNTTRQEFVANLRRKSSGFSRGASVYRGVTRHHQHGRWQARIGRVAGNKDLYLGTFSTQEEAAEAYDIATIKFRGPNAVTNFDISKYDAKLICSSSHLIGGELAKRSPKETNPALSELAVIDSTKSGADELSEAWPNLTLDTLPFTWPSTSTDPDWLGAKVETFKHQVSYHNMYGDYSHGFFYTSAATDYELGRYGDGCGGANWMVAAGKQPPAFTLWND